ncbi:hypothetical protein ACFZBU_46665 [Embleya sp. NPDC008237]
MHDGTCGCDRDKGEHRGRRRVLLPAVVGGVARAVVAWLILTLTNQG